MANASPNGKEFFEHLNRAVVLSEKASDGEKLLIMAARAGANNDAGKQKDYLEELVRDFPNDERAQFALGGFYFAQQDFKQAIAQYKKATEINPGLTTAWNLLGYAVPPERRLRERREGLPEVRRADPEGPESRTTPTPSCS